MTHRTKIAAAAALAIALAGACSLGDVKRDACTGDAQCAAAFGAGSTCQAGYCTDPSSSPDCNKTDATGRACFGCKPLTQPEFHTACTDASCQPFDNQKRLTKLTPDGGLPPLP